MNFKSLSCQFSIQSVTVLYGPTEPHQTPETRIAGLHDAKEIASMSFAV